MAILSGRYDPRPCDADVNLLLLPLAPCSVQLAGQLVISRNTSACRGLHLLSFYRLPSRTLTQLVEVGQILEMRSPILGIPSKIATKNAKLA